MNAGELKFFLRNVRDDAEVLVGRDHLPLISIGYPDAARKLDDEGKYGCVALIGQVKETIVGEKKCDYCPRPLTCDFCTRHWWGR